MATATDTRACRRTGSTETDAGLDDVVLGEAGEPAPGLLLAWCPSDVVCADRVRIADAVRIGRARTATWFIPDPRLSGAHLELVRHDGEVVVRDLGSTNGTLVNGNRLAGGRALADQDVLRAGRCVFVFQADLAEIAAASGTDAGRYGFAGSFHSPALVARIEHAVRTGRHLLIEGESGTGKELVARCAHAVACPAGPFVAHNCARFATTEEAETTIFGVARGVFSGVDARAGLIEQADGGTLYLDELPNLPARVQRSLLRFAEDGLFARIGEAKPRPASVRLQLGTNRPVDAAIADGTLAGDLVARTHLLAVPPLRSRRADVPKIFLACFAKAAKRAGLAEVDVREPLVADYFEGLALHDCRDRNVRFLEDLAADAAARLAGAAPDKRKEALAAVFGRRLAGSPVLGRFQQRESEAAPQGRPASAYEQHREAIVAAYRELGGNLSAVEDALRKQGVELHRRWIAVFLERWGVRKRKRRIPDLPPKPPAGS